MMGLRRPLASVACAAFVPLIRTLEVEKLKVEIAVSIR
jgi:hypothetical protein